MPVARGDTAVSLNRYAKRRDQGEREIVAALQLAGWTVWRELPCDLLLWKRGEGFRTLENKSAKARKRKDQQKQQEFLALTGTPIAKTPEEALRAVGSMT